MSRTKITFTHERDEGKESIYNIHKLSSKNIYIIIEWIDEFKESKEKDKVRE
jgi:hypothetical protein